jgi:AraC-like DNA-binding protein
VPIWSTDALPAHERFDVWREVRARHLFGVTAELPADQRPGFSARMTTRSIGRATLIEMRASPYSVERSARDIARAPGDSLCLYQQRGGGAWFGTDADDFVLRPGALATSHTDLTYETRPTGPEGFDLRILKVPFPARPGGGIAELAASPVAPHDRLALCLAGSLATLLAPDSPAPVAEGPDPVDTIAQLILLSRGAAPRGLPESRQAVRRGLLDAARMVTAERFRQRSLGPRSVADHLGISVRQLHLLFEPTGSTFHRSLNVLRVADAKRQLVEKPQRSIAGIAFAAGFDSLPTFYRTFRAVDGHAPGDYRR